MVKPGGTGMPILHISARLAPLPPSSSFIFPSPSAVFPPKKYTCLGMVGSRTPGTPGCNDHENVGTGTDGGKGRWRGSESPGRMGEEDGKWKRPSAPRFKLTRRWHPPSGLRTSCSDIPWGD